MDNNLIMFSSVTLTMKSRDLLKSHNINARMVRTPIHLRNKSCGYSLLVTRNINEAINILKYNKIQILGIDAVDFR